MMEHAETDPPASEALTAPLADRDHRLAAGQSTKNINTGPGRQTINTLNGGSHNRYYVADTIHFHERSATPPSPCFTVPFARDHHFVVTPELLDLEGRLKSESRAQRTAVFGIGGVGKSQLAIEYCYRVQDNEPETWILWLHASSAARFDYDIRKLADDVEIPRRHDNTNVFQLVHNWLNQPIRKWLIVLDNADDVDYLFEPPQTTDTRTQQFDPQVERRRIDYLPFSKQSSVLITTRNHDAASRLVDVDNIIRLQPSKAHALKLLESKLRDTTQPLLLEQLAHALDNIPLALSQAVAYIMRTETPCSVQDYLTLLREGKETLLLSDAFRDIRRDRQDVSAPVITTWHVTFTHIRQMRPSAADRLSLMSFCNHQGIPESILKAPPNALLQPPLGPTKRGWKSWLSHVLPLTRHSKRAHMPPEAGESSTESSQATTLTTYQADVKLLCDFALVTRTTAEGTFEMHRLVQLAAQEWLRRDNGYLHWEEQSVRRLNDAFPVPDHNRWPDCRTLLPHVPMSIESQDRYTLIYLACTLHKAAWYQLEQGAYVEAGTRARKALELRNDVVGAHHLSTLEGRSLLGLILQRQGHYDDAESMDRQTLELCNKLLGKDSQVTLATTNNLAWTLTCQRKSVEAEKFARIAMQGFEIALGPDHLSTSRSTSSLALALECQERYGAAESLYRQALAGFEKLDDTSPDTLATLSRLSSVLQRQGNWKAAEYSNRRAVEGFEATLGGEHPATLMGIWTSGQLHYGQGNHELALELYRKAASGFDKVLDESHPTTVACKTQLREACMSSMLVE